MSFVFVTKVTARNRTFSLLLNCSYKKGKKTTKLNCISLPFIFQTDLRPETNHIYMDRREVFIACLAGVEKGRGY